MVTNTKTTETSTLNQSGGRLLYGSPSVLASGRFNRLLREENRAIEQETIHSQEEFESPPPPPTQALTRESTKIFDDAAITAGYESVPLIQIDKLPRGGISFETKGVGRIQFGIPPETIKDSMVLGMEVPTVYIVPVERFCRELGHALGLNFAEFEFPAYFNFFVKRKRVQLVVDSADAEDDIRTVFEETLLGPAIFRDPQYPLENVEEDFDPNFPRDARPNFFKEFLKFRLTSEDSTNELCTDTLLEFIHFQRDRRNYRSSREERPMLGVPPNVRNNDATNDCIETKKIEVNDDAILTPPLRRNSTTAGQQMHLQLATNDDIDIKGSYAEPVRGVRRNLSDDGKVLNKSIHSRRESDSSRSLPLSAAGGFLRGALSIGEAHKSPFEASVPSLLDKNLIVPNGRRDSTISFNSDLTSEFGLRESKHPRGSRLSVGSSVFADFNYDFLDDVNNLQDSHWMYSQAKWLGEVATVYPPDATDLQKTNNSTARVEIFKMAGGTEYIVHDVDSNNIIVGKARFSGTVRVPDDTSVRALISPEDCPDGETPKEAFKAGSDGGLAPAHLTNYRAIKTFHPPSFGVTVLGNSHGFDKNGNTSGYVLWVNGRGIMIDPPPYSSSALEREGIRSQMIIAIIITHCHADHDAGAFQKIMTGARVAIITTPTIYKSFIRKYSALSGLSPDLLRQSHRFRPAIIGQQLKIQGATFYFTYTLHTIPCISFKAEWRGRSIVFTGDHMNIPEQIDLLVEKGTLSKGRADDLKRLPIQECDILLHEAGAPPIHTPLRVLQELPQKVRDRLYVVHTAAIPADSGLRVAPVGTAGTLRLDESGSLQHQDGARLCLAGISAQDLQDGTGKSLTMLGDFYGTSGKRLRKNSCNQNGELDVPPLVFTRPTDVSDAWFILNLLSAVPFLASLSYAHTMEVLEIANVEVFRAGEVVLEGARRSDFLCVFWEGACREQVGGNAVDGKSFVNSLYPPCIWHAGDWTGPVSLQPDLIKCERVVPGENQARDIIAIPREGVKVILLLMKDLHQILKAGSKYYRRYLSIEGRQRGHGHDSSTYLGTKVDHSHESLIDVLQFNSVLACLHPKQKRHLESLAEGPRHFPSQSMLWKVGDPVDFAYIIVSGSATLTKKTTNEPANSPYRRGSTGAICHSLVSIDEQESDGQKLSLIVPVECDKVLQNVQPNSEYSRLETVLQLRVEEIEDDCMLSRNDTLDSNEAQRDKFANKVLARLYSRHAFTENLVFSRGHFLCDTSRMVSGDFANSNQIGSRTSVGSLPADQWHTSNMMAGPDGCLVYIFPKSSFVHFLDSNPGVLLSLLGSQVVV